MTAIKHRKLLPGSVATRCDGSGQKRQAAAAQASSPTLSYCRSGRCAWPPARRLGSSARYYGKVAVRRQIAWQHIAIRHHDEQAGEIVVHLLRGFAVIPGKGCALGRNHGQVLVGIISDTHGLLRPEAIDALRGSDLIIHAGDVGKPEVLAELRLLAPVFVVRGNIDTQKWAADLPARKAVQIGLLTFYVLHDIGDLDLAIGGFAAVVYGHSHRPSIANCNGVLFLNPGSAGPRRFKLPVSIARVHVSGSHVRPEIVELQVRSDIR
jgi:uncharacterized protein